MIKLKTKEGIPAPQELLAANGEWHKVWSKWTEFEDSMIREKSLEDPRFDVSTVGAHESTPEFEDAFTPEPVTEPVVTEDDFCDVEPEPVKPPVYVSDKDAGIPERGNAEARAKGK